MPENQISNPPDPYEVTREHIRNKARNCLREKRSEESVSSILDRARGQIHILGLLAPLPRPLTSEDKERLIQLLEEAKPLVERAFPFPQSKIAKPRIDQTTGELATPTFGELLGQLLKWLRVPVEVLRGRPRDDAAIFARRMLKWGAEATAAKCMEAQLTPLELCSVALIAGIQSIPNLTELEREDWEERIRLIWEKLHQRNVPKLQADRNTSE